MGIHKILNENKKTLQEYKNYPKRFSPFYCKCEKPILSKKYGDKQCQKCGFEIRR